MEEKRRYPRHDHALEARYSTLDNTSQITYTVSKNISKSGLSMPAAASLKSGDFIKLDIGLGGGKSSISVIGVVVWTRDIPRPALLKKEAGVKFTRVDAEEIDKFFREKSLIS